VHAHDATPSAKRTMPRMRIALLTIVAMFAFAGNSLLCRIALKGTSIDPATFTSVRIVSAAIVLWIILRSRGQSQPFAGNWLSAFALFTYAAAFSFAYVSLAAGTGALLLFGAVQATMIGYALCRGERLRMLQWTGLACALAGLVALVLPGVSAPPLLASLLMLCAGIAWGAYSLRGKRAADPTATTAGNFIRAIPFAAAISIAMFARIDRQNGPAFRGDIRRVDVGCRLCDLVRRVEGDQGHHGRDGAIERAADRRHRRHRAARRTTDHAPRVERGRDTRRHRARDRPPLTIERMNERTIESRRDKRTDIYGRIHRSF
jgi:hypothetical protein